MSKESEYKGEFKPGAAAESIISMSQALLAPLDSIVKAQVHAARSFLNFVLQMGYGHKPLDENGEHKGETEQPDQSDKIYMTEFTMEVINDQGQKELALVKIPTLSLVPVSPLSIDEADFKIDFRVSHIFRKTQMQQSEGEVIKTEEDKYSDEKRPWFLVSDPVSLRGVIAPNVAEQVKSSTSFSEESVISINIKLSKQAMPSGLDKLLTTLTQSGQMTKIQK
jgi:hypothetical protein